MMRGAERYRQSLADTWRLLGSDIEAAAGQAAVFSGAHTSLVRRISIMLWPGGVCCFCYRLSHWAWLRQWFWLARLFHLVNYLLHKADISPAASIGPGLYIPHTVGVIVYGHAGSYLRVLARAMMAPHGPRPSPCCSLDNAPVLGDQVTLGVDSVVVGAVRLGNAVRVGPGVLVARDVGAGVNLVSRVRTRIERQEEPCIV